MDRDCTVSATWSPWSLCYDMNSCGVGKQNRTRTITQPQTLFGAGCAPTAEYKPCNITTPGALPAASSTVPAPGNEMNCFAAPVTGRYCGKYTSYCSTMTNRLGSERTVSSANNCVPSKYKICAASANTAQLRQAACAGACLGEPGCESANYRESMKRCSLYSGTVNGGTNPGTLDTKTSGYVYLARKPPQNCAWTWSDWTSCSTACESAWGTPQRSRTQVVAQQPQCGGLACPAVNVEYQSCAVFSCNTFQNVSSVLLNSCSNCTGPSSTECLAATCASGFYSFSGGRCSSCHRFEGDVSVITGSCTVCSGGSAQQCTAATCSVGYTSYNSGKCTAVAKAKCSSLASCTAPKVKDSSKDNTDCAGTTCTTAADASTCCKVAPTKAKCSSLSSCGSGKVKDSSKDNT
eukprot:COSAG01_NODE_1447_length_10278_cov_47.625209_17_plen_406_part_01